MASTPQLEQRNAEAAKNAEDAREVQFFSAIFAFSAFQYLFK